LCSSLLHFSNRSVEAHHDSLGCEELGKPVGISDERLGGRSIIVQAHRPLALQQFRAHPPGQARPPTLQEGSGWPRSHRQTRDPADLVQKTRRQEVRRQSGPKEPRPTEGQPSPRRPHPQDGNGQSELWGYDRIAGALKNLGHTISDQTVGNILRRHGLPPSPSRGSSTTWADFINSHQHVITACDFFSAEVFTQAGLTTFYVLFFMKIATREVDIAGITTNPNEARMMQVARNLTMEGWGFLKGQRHLILDRDTKFTAEFRKTIQDSGTKILRLPPRSSNLNSFSERFVRSVKEEMLSKLILFGEASLTMALREYLLHYHRERNHQGKGNVLLFPSGQPKSDDESKPIEMMGEVKCRRRLGGLLKYYHREAA